MNKFRFTINGKPLIAPTNLEKVEVLIPLIKSKFYVKLLLKTGIVVNFCKN